MTASTTAVAASQPPTSTQPATAPAHHAPHQSFWLFVLCLTGVDYFSTLAYQPSIAFTAAGRLAPLATICLILLTLFGALPVYFHVARSSPNGQGSIAMLQRLLAGWRGKFLVLVMLGFAATDFVITITMSAADAAEHLLHNPLWANMPWWLHSQVGVTLFMVLLLGALFLRGFREVIGVAVVLVLVYLLLNVIIVVTGLQYVAMHPDLVTQWWQQIRAGDIAVAGHTNGEPLGLMRIVLLSVWLFPKLILGLSGFETGVAVMPLIRGDASDTAERPLGRIRNARKLLATSALIMCGLLFGSSVVVTMLIPASELLAGGEASNRALAYLAHGEGPHRLGAWCGELFGTVYDVSTVVILWFAGASALSGLLSLIPRYLPQYGMAPSWLADTRPLVITLTCICVFVTVLFQADVIAQGAAYATGVMVLILSGCIAVSIERYRAATGSRLKRFPWVTVLITALFGYATTAIVLEKPDGLMIASTFIASTIVISIISRVYRSTELRVTRFDFVDAESRFLWDSLLHLEIPILVPHRPGGRTIEEKEKELRERHHLAPDVPVVFVEVSLGDPSDFFQEPRLSVHAEEGCIILRVDRCTAIAPALAAISMHLSRSEPVEVHFGWSDESPLRTNLGFLLFGEGNVPWLVRDLICRAEPDETRRPRVVIG